jgi:hypothetical protein
MQIKYTWVRNQILATALGALVLPSVRAEANQQVASLNCTAPVAVSAPPKPDAAKAPSTPRIVIEPTQLDRRVLAAGDTASLGVTNESSAAIENLSFSFSELLDSKSGHGISPQTISTTLHLDVGQKTNCTFALPVGNRAGVFSGSLTVQGPPGVGAPVPVVIRMRGPEAASCSALPLLLFTSVLLVGWLLSSLLHSWYTTRLPVVQQVLLLRERKASFERFLTRIDDFEKLAHAPMPKIKMSVAFANGEIDSALTVSDTSNIANLQALQQRSDLISQLNDRLWIAMQIAQATTNAKLGEYARLLDNVPRGTDVNAYEEALKQVLTSPPPARDVTVSAQVTVASLSNTTSADLHSKVRMMDSLKALSVGVIVWISAFSFFYYPNASFGSVVDYISLFLWAVGLTATGSQLVSSVHK